MDFDIIIACDSAYGMGKRDKGKLPWKISQDMIFFKETTLSPDEENVVIMGRKTADTFRYPLPGRLNIVITSNTEYRCNEGFHAFTSLHQALTFIKNAGIYNKVFVIGGAQLIQQAIRHRHCRTVYLNRLSENYNCDICLPQEVVEYLNSTFTKTYHIGIGNCAIINKGIAIEYGTYKYVNKQEMVFLNTVRDVFMNGSLRNARGALTRAKFFSVIEFDLALGFPLLTSKQVFYRIMFSELCFMLRGDTNTKHLEEVKNMTWHENTTKEFIDKNDKNLQEGDMGPMYGYQWRFYGAKYHGCELSYEGQGLDQLKILIDTIVTNPESRRLLMTTYNPAQAEEGVLYPCHSLITQFGIEDALPGKTGQRISVIMYQRSGDLFLGVPFNFGLVAGLLHVVVNLVNNHPGRKHDHDYVVGRVIIVLADLHIYVDKERGDHTLAIIELLSRADKTYPFCNLEIRKILTSVDNLKELRSEDFNITDYIHGPIIKAKLVA